MQESGELLLSPRQVNELGKIKHSIGFNAPLSFAEKMHNAIKSSFIKTIHENGHTLESLEIK
jgi:Ca2+-binding EF-hand superfamily protein